MATTPDTGRPRPGKRWGWWLFIVVNLAGLLLIIPLLRDFPSLMRIWWHTRSQASLASTQSATNLNAPPASTNLVAADTQLALQSLTNQASVIQHLPDSDLSQIVSLKYGARKKGDVDTNVFDQAGAVFEKITRFTTNIDGRTHYGYLVTFVDPSGNHETQTDLFEEPNLEYERSMATLELIAKNPQLKRIYEAMAYVLAEKAQTNAPASDGPEPR